MSEGCEISLYIILVRISTLLTILILLHWGLDNERYRSDPECGAKFCIVWGVIKIAIGLALWCVLNLTKCGYGDGQAEYHYEYLYPIMVGVGCLVIGFVYTIQIPRGRRTPLISDDDIIQVV